MAGSTVRTAVLVVAATLAAVALAGLLYIYSGAYNVAATQDHTAVGRWLLNTTRNRSVAVRAEDVPDPLPLDSATVVDGFRRFRSSCVVCHGAPGVDRGVFGRGITPEPPSLSRAAESSGAKELFWIVKHGIKMAGMPAFGPSHSDQELWGVVAFLRRLPGMSPEEYAALEARYAEEPGGHGHGGGAADEASATPGTGAED